MKSLSKSLFLILMLVVVGSVAADEGAANQLPVTRMVVLGDRTGGHVPGIYGEIIKEVNLLKPDIILTVGDMIEGYVDDSAKIMEQKEEYDSLVSDLTAPLYFTPGNHDISNDIAESIFKGDRPHAYYSFDFNTVHFIVLDNSRFDDPYGWPEDQIAWLRQDLNDHQNASQTLVFFHKPFWNETIALGKPDTLHNIFRQYGVDAVFTGHYHAYFSGLYDGIKYLSVSSSGAETSPGPTGVQYHFAWVTLNDPGVEIALIDKGGVRPWDDLTTSDRRVARNIEYHAVEMSQPFIVGSDMEIPDSSFTLNIKNLSPSVIDDTLYWDVPSAWSIQPQKQLVHLDSGQAQTYVFRTANSGDIYPLPQIAIDMPFSKGREFTIHRTMKIARVAEASAAKKAKIDGLLNEPFWNHPVEKFFDWDGGPMKADSTRFAFAYDKDNLYLGAICYDPHMDSIVASVTDRDGAIYGEDCVGYFIQPNPDSMVAYQIYFNPLGTCYDSKITVDSDGYANGDTKWDGKYKVKTIRGDGYWSFEALIPLKQFAAIARKGGTMNLNFRRKQKRLDAVADWMEIDHHPDSYGILKLE